MPLIKWSDQYSVTFSRIDEQHKKLIDLINDLHDALAAAKAKEALGKILQGLINYTVTHFAFEEQMMKTHAYPDFANHKKMHDDLVKQVSDLNQKFTAGNTFITTEVMNFLKTWLTGHIMNVDKKLGAFLAEKGLK